MTRIITLLSVFLLLLALVSCQGGTHSDTTLPPETDGATVEETTANATHFRLNAENVAGFTIVRPEVCGADTVNGVLALNARLDEIGLDLKIKMDFVRKGDEIPSDQPEILIGATNRPESVKYYETLRADDYVIAIKEKQIVIVGGSDKATEAAVKEFIDVHLKDAVGEIVLPIGLLSSKIGVYRIDKLNLCGKGVNEYEIVIPSNADAICKHAASLISDRIRDASGFRVNVVSEKKATGKPQIRITYSDKPSSDTSYVYKASDNGIELSATSRTLLYAVRKLTDVLTDKSIADSLDLTPQLNTPLTMELPAYALPSSLEGKTPIALCDQKNGKAVVIDLSASDPTASDAILWEWSPTSKNGFNGTGFGHRIDEIKLRYSPLLKKYVVLVASSAGFMGIAEYPSGQRIWEVGASGNNPHSMDYTSSGLVACAMSTGGDEIRLYACDASGKILTKYVSDPLTGAHAVHWDEEFGILWAMGNSEIIAYEISGSSEAPVMNRISGLGCNIGSGGHDFSLIPSESGLFWFSTSSAKIFDKYKNKVVEDYQGKDVISSKAIKSICGLPDGRVVRAVATGVYASHNTDVLSVFTPQENGTYTKTNYVFDGRAFYKARPFMLH